MPDITEWSRFFKSLADPTRLKIVEYLARAENPRCVGSISKHIGISQSATSQHLRILRQAYRVNSDRRGYHIHYEINTEQMDEEK
jgi:ArsR family transcriptional regulator